MSADQTLTFVLELTSILSASIHTGIFWFSPYRSSDLIQLGLGVADQFVLGVMALEPEHFRVEALEPMAFD